MIRAIAIQTDLMQHRATGDIAENIKAIAPVEVNTVRHAVRLNARAFVADKFRMISILRWRRQALHVLKSAAFIDFTLPLPTGFLRNFRSGTFDAGLGRDGFDLPLLLLAGSKIRHRQQAVEAAITVAVDELTGYFARTCPD